MVTPRVLASHQVRGGLSSASSKLNDTLTEMLNFAEGILEDRKEDWYRFPVYLLATAGFRRLRPEQREGVLQTVRLILGESNFHSEPDFVRILSGEEEGAYGWLAVNSEMGSLSNPGPDSVGVLDLGGASMQITFVPEADRSVLQHAFPLFLQGRQSNLYSASYLQFGLREAQRLLQRQLIGKALVAETTEVLEHPCLPKGSNSTELLIGDEAAQQDAAAAGAAAFPPLTATWHGMGHYDDCIEKLGELFDKTAPCYLPACTFNGRYQPTLGARKFVAFSAFSWVVDVLGLPAETTALEDIENAARYVCKMDWTLLHERWQLGEQALQSLCFSAAYVVVLLHHGLGFDKKSQQIIFVPQGNLSWAKGAIIWEANNRFSRHQPVCIPGEPALVDKDHCTAPDHC